MITAEKARLVNLLRKRLSFHIKLCIKTELSPREVFLLCCSLSLKYHQKKTGIKKKFGEWSWEAERKKLLESWKSVQGNESLTKLTFDDYVKIKKEIIYYYNLVAFYMVKTYIKVFKRNGKYPIPLFLFLKKHIRRDFSERRILWKEKKKSFWKKRENKN